MNEHMQQRLAAVDARKVEERKANLIRLLHANITRVEHDPVIIHEALVDTLLLFLVTELFAVHEDKAEVRRQVFRFIRIRMDEMLKKQEQAAKMLGNANDG